ncbi:MAG: hypothetical protein JXA42_13160 [Anaerolineales bacterium]|nr:hypothetical protein [Anaerolineales bacterium]
MLRNNDLNRNKQKVWFVITSGYLPIFFFIVLVFCFTWPLIGQLGSSIPGNENDAYVHYWTHHWVARAIKNGDIERYTTEIFYPYGISLVNHNKSWFNIFVWMILKPFFGAAAAYTLEILLLLAFNGYAVYLLAKDLTGSKSASMLAGVIASTWPFINTHLQHANLVVIGFIPLSLIFIRRFIRDNRLRDLILSAIFISFIGIVRLQILVMSMLLIGPFIVYCLIISKRDLNLRTISKLLLMGVLAGIILIPFVAPVISHLLTQEKMGALLYEKPNPHQSDLLSYLLPGPYHPLWGETIKLLETRIIIPTYVPFIGYSVLLLAIIGLFGRWRKSLFWFFSALVIGYFSLGPTPFIGRNQTISLPFQPLYNQILIPVLRELDRFNVILVIPFSILAAWGCLYLMSKRLLFKKKILWPAVAIILVLFEFTMIPIPNKSLSVPEWYRVLAQEPEQFGILDIPMKRQLDEQYMLYQLVHGKSLVEGHVSRPPEEAYRFINAVPLLAFFRMERSIVPPAGDFNISQQLVILNRTNIRYLILHKEFLSSEELALWQNWLAVKPHHEDDDLVVYETLTSSLEEEFVTSPQLGDKIQVVQSCFSPQATIQMGWIQLDTFFFISEILDNIDNKLCIALVDKNGSISQTSCDYRVNKDNGELDPVTGLVRRYYLVQVDSSIPDGEYEVVFYQPSGATNVLPERYASLGNLSVNALPQKVDRPDPETPLDIIYQQKIALIGYNLDQSNTALQLILFWQALTCPEESFKIFVHVVDEKTNAIVAQQDFIPGNWQNPTDLWQAGDYVRDELLIDLTNVPSGEYRVQVGIYKPESGERLQTFPPWQDNAAILSIIHRD